MVVVVFGLALIFGTRWCILTFYSGTYASTDPRGVQGHIQLASPTKQSSQEKEIPFSTLTPQLQAVHESRDR